MEKRDERSEQPSAEPETPEDVRDSSLERYLGSAIRELRRKHGLTIADIAERADISRGMLSKIENGQTATSLESLKRIARALGESLSGLFRNFEVVESGAQLVKKGESMEVARRGTRTGHTYHLLAYDQGPIKLFEPFLITIEQPTETFPIFEHPGTEFIYMLEGRIRYRHGKNIFDLSPGDALTFRGDVPHGPEELVQTPIRFLSITIYREQPPE